MTTQPDSWSIPRTLWVGLAAAALYVLLAAVVGNLLDPLAGGDETLDFVITEYIPVAILIAVGLLFARKAGWLREAWTAPSPFTERRRWWLLAIPALLTIQTVLILAEVPWSERAWSVVLIYLIGSLLIGIGEELYFRGIFRVAVRGHHGELATLLITSIAFGLAHTVSYIFNGVPIGATALSVAFLAMNGALFYGALRATGTLWVPILLHALGDFARFMQQGTDARTESPSFGDDAATAAVEFALIGLSMALVISLARSDRRHRQSLETSLT
ncbi:CPBP family intramembrane glutamic endopeptidase [Citricoccus sp.]|uniref:CPBP family intramembrane glutamic endopeptidase n=1 Tax=Citricoccus sp. TaxID=1978372 RepID=UPI0028BD531A|nr:CPBP family intramembrane glutamic endopeptidase [Citricoccus sp.]